MLKVGHHPAKIGGYKHCGIADFMALVRHVILKDHVIKGHVTQWVGIPQGKLTSYQVWWLQALRYWRWNGFSMSCALSRPRNQRIMWLYRKDPIKLSHHPAKSDGHRNNITGNILALILLLILQDHVIK